MANSPREWTDGSSVRLDRQDPYLRLQSVTIYVRDLDQSLNFYLEQLGFQLIFDARIQPGRRSVTVAPPDGTANLTLVAPDPGSEQLKLIGRPVPVTFVTEDVIAKYREWTKRGVRFQFAPRLKRLKYEVHVRAPQSADSSAPGAEHAPIWGGVFTRFRDLDGNSFSLVSFDEVTQAVEAQRRALADRLESDRRIAQELEIAKQVQARLFPQSQPPLKTLEYAGLCIQARKVGGDYYDFLDLGKERLGFVIGDISGKGIAAALFSSPNMTIPSAACATRIAAISPACCSTVMTPLSASTPLPPCLGFSRIGIAKLENASFSQVIPSRSTPTASPNPTTLTTTSSASSALSKSCSAIVMRLHNLFSPRSLTKSSASAPASSATTSPSSSPNT